MSTNPPHPNGPNPNGETVNPDAFRLAPPRFRLEDPGDWSLGFPKQLEPGDAMPDPTKPFDPAENYDVDLGPSVRAIVRGEKVTIVSTDELAPYYAVQKAKMYLEQRLEALNAVNLPEPPEALGVQRYYALQPAPTSIDPRYRREAQRLEQERFGERTSDTETVA